ncbi:phosphomannomutase/phosphoglucomutase [Amorphoplanes digitatis]|uniref:Phosphomannomutase n=1 Tax=Actinoplanes digitatis TaxID=1868 RepID=A0A7W7I4L1_9ACTN|nr:phosphomannomutase/phosphoglucomutase [Actinoplanes digitatis]MBB4766331.1 phosphomannomutase [Actinoplanes digitatis]BFE76393.1 phosphomannomutase/phosphoglucomutase [Actinoplanes digitatis]GID96035.1 phosphomannomutase/phosphoglucomutase [Actinoplanes digitatis]
MTDLSQLVKAYDVRGVVPEQLNETVARALGTAFVEMLRESGDEAERIVIAHDMRETGPALVAAFAAGANSAGSVVVHIGLGSTDQLYYASGVLGLPGAMFTASHNPAQYNGIKLCRAGARPVGQDSGLVIVRQRAEELLDDLDAVGEVPSAIEHRDLLADYAGHLRSLVDLSGIRPLKVVVDAGNGMGGHTVPAVLGDQVLPALPLEIVPLYFELDGSFPNHEANPLDPANLVDLQAAVRRHGADLGLAFDGDADRCFVVDEKGDPVSPSAVTALVAKRELAKFPGSTIIHNLITSAAVPEIIKENGGVPVRSRVGHSFIKAEMARTNAVFGGEHSAHYYFRDFWFADTGMLAALHVLAALGEQEQPLSAFAAEFERYSASGEINSKVADAAAKVAEVRAAFPDATFDNLDGMTAELADGSWFNLRASNTEPLLRLNVEAAKPDRMAALRDEVLSIVRG